MEILKKVQKWTEGMEKHWKVILIALGIWLSLSSLIGGALFISEEAQQQCVFASWFAQSAGRYDLVIKSADLAEKIGNRGRTINNLFGWINPFGYIAYQNYFSIANPNIVHDMRVLAEQKANGGDNQASAVDTSSWTDPKTIWGEKGLQGVTKWSDAKIGQSGKFLVPVYKVAKHSTVAILESGDGFNMVTFPKGELWKTVEQLGNNWLIVTGTVKAYKGSPEIVLSKMSQIIDKQPLQEVASK